MKQLIALCLLLAPSFATAQLAGVEYNWKQKRDKNGIIIETSKVAGSPFKAVRSEMVVNASVSSLVALVEDLAVCSEWADLCKESRIEKRLSDTNAFVYIYNNLPFPVSDRDVYTHVIWTQNPESKTVTMTSTASPGGPAKTKAVRIKNAVSQWHFTPNGDGTTKVENFAHINPNGPVPAWITNQLLVSSPYKTMTKMRKIVESGRYDDAIVTFLN